jgi:hypothetical protein
MRSHDHAVSLTRDATSTRLMRETMPLAIFELANDQTCILQSWWQENELIVETRRMVSEHQRLGELRHDQQAGRHVTSSHGHDTGCTHEGNATAVLGVGQGQNVARGSNSVASIETRCFARLESGKLLCRVAHDVLEVLDDCFNGVCDSLAISARACHGGQAPCP